MIKSKDKTDKRLLDQYLIQQAHRLKIPLGLEDDEFHNDEYDFGSSLGHEKVEE